MALRASTSSAGIVRLVSVPIGPGAGHPPARVIIPFVNNLSRAWPTIVTMPIQSTATSQ